jgi:hypothetical protein
MTNPPALRFRIIKADPFIISKVNHLRQKQRPQAL